MTWNKSRSANAAKANTLLSASLLSDRVIFIGFTETRFCTDQVLFVFQIKYKGNTKAEISSSLYSLLPETTETQFVKELTEILSEVRHDGGMEGALGVNLTQKHYFSSSCCYK